MNWLRLHVSNLCNFKCPNCHVFELGENNLPNRVMDQRIFDEAIENFTQSMNHLGLKETIVSIYGGETLANKKVIKAGIEKFGREHNGIALHWVVNTNGSLLKEEDVLFFKENNVELHISVDGREEIHNLSRPTHKGKGTFHMVIPGLELVKKHGCPAQINSYMQPTNWLHLKDIVDIAENYGIKKIYLDQFYNSEMISYKVGVEKYREVYFYGLNKGISINGPWGRVLKNFHRNLNKREGLLKRLSLDVNIDGSCYVPSDSVRTKKLNLRIENFSKYVRDGGWEDVCHNIRQRIDKSCEGCPIKDYCYGAAIEQVHYHIGDHADPKVSCDFFRDWIKFLTRPVYYRKFPELTVLSVLPLEEISDLIGQVRQGIQGLSSRLWNLNGPIFLNVTEFRDEFLAATKQPYLPDWVKATTSGNTLFHRGVDVTVALIHELTHIFLTHRNLKLPPWLTEGVCEWVQNADFDRDFLAQAVRERPLDEIVFNLQNGSHLIQIDSNKPDQNSVYIQARGFVDFLVRRYFDDDIRKMLIWDENLDFEQHIQKVTGKSLPELFVDFKEDVVAEVV